MSFLRFPVFVGVGVFFSFGLDPVHGYQGQAQVSYAADDAMQRSLVGYRAGEGRERALGAHRQACKPVRPLAAGWLPCGGDLYGPGSHRLGPINPKSYGSIRSGRRKFGDGI